MYCKLNNIDFVVNIDENDEVFYQARQGAMHYKALQAICKRYFAEDDINVFNPVNGVFSTRGADAVYLARMRCAETVDEVLDIVFEEETA